jgi:hypothetical protein
MKDIFRNRIDGLFQRKAVDTHNDAIANHATGNPVDERFHYDPYGFKASFSPSEGDSTDAKIWQCSFQGGINDAVAELSHFEARDRDPATGRWVGQDPECCGVHGRAES